MSSKGDAQRAFMGSRGMKRPAPRKKPVCTLSRLAPHPANPRPSPIHRLRATKFARRMRIADPPPIPADLLVLFQIPNFTLPVPAIDPTDPTNTSTIAPPNPPFVPTAGEFDPWPPTPVT